MPRKQKSDEEVDILNQQITDWAKTYGHQSDPYLLAIRDDLTAQRNLEFWASVDPLDYLPNFDAHMNVPILKLARFAGGIRNIIIFMPVALTWAAVAEATTKFNDFVNANEGTPANFLQFWQDGYGLLDSFWRIGSVAITDFAIILVVILLSAFISVTQTRGNAIANRLKDLFSRERRNLALSIHMHLWSHREVTATGIPASVRDGIKALRQSAREANQQTDALRKSTEKFVTQAMKSGEAIAKTASLTVRDATKAINQAAAKSGRGGSTR